MPGMTSGLSDTNPVIVAAFKAALLFVAGMAVLQAWRGRGFWQGTLHGQPGPLASMVSSMASLLQTVRVAIPYGSSS
jgi:hypothetical protein